MPVLFHDYETHSKLGLTEVGAWKYATHASTAVWCCAYAVDDQLVQLWIPGDPVPPEFIEAVHNPDWITSAFGDHFERLITQHVMGPRYGWPLVPIERRRCSQAAALALALPAKLKSVALVLKLEHQKNEGGRRVMLRLARGEEPRPGDLDKLYAYCRNDVAVERDLHHKIDSLIPEEQAQWALDTVANDRGIYIDGELLNAAIKIAEAAHDEINGELQTITNSAVETVHQTAKLIAWLADHDCVVTDVQKTTLNRALTQKNLSTEARRVIELRLEGAHAAAAKLLTMRDWRNGDGRARGVFRYHGASTGRWTSFGIQLQNLKRPLVEDMGAAIEAVGSGDLERLKQHYPQPMSVVGDITRALIRASPGHRLIAADLSGIESRVTAWVSGQQSKLDQWAKFDRTQNPEDEPYYIFGRALGVASARARTIGKTADLAFGYMGGPGAWKKLAPDDDTSTKEQIKRRQQAWRSAHPHTVAFWGKVNRAAIQAVRKPGTTVECGRFTFKSDDTFLRIKLPSGRKLAYPFPRLQPDKYDNLAVVFMDNAGGKWTECRYGHGAYGGTWIENIVQAVARDLFAAAMPRLEAAGYPIVLHVHDEIVAEVPDGCGSAEEFLQILTTPPAWADGLPIAAKVWNGQRFCKIKSTTEAPPTQPRVGISGGAEVPNGSEKPASELPNGSGSEHNPESDDADEERTGVHICAQCHLDPPDGSERASAYNNLFLHARCEETFIRARMAEEGLSGSTTSDEEPDPPPRGNGGGYPWGEREFGRKVAEFIYRDMKGAPYLKVVKRVTKQGKSYPQYHVENGGWVKGKPDGPAIPYRLPELLAAPPGAAVWIPEGELCADALATLGLIATTNPGGAGKWTPELNKWLTGFPVAYVCEDNDAAGRDHVSKVATALNGTIPEIRVLTFRELREHGDVKDWIDAKGTLEQLLEHANQAPKFAALECVCATDEEMEALDWIWPGRFALGKIGLLVGLPDEGKGLTFSDIIARITRGSPWPCNEGHAPLGNVILLTAEDDTRDTIIPRLVAAGADLSRVTIVKMMHEAGKQRMFSLISDLEALRQKVVEIGNVKMILIDPITAYLGIGKIDSFRATDVRAVLGPLKEFAAELRVSILAIMHFNKKIDITNVLLRISDSLAYGATARHAYAVVDDPNNNRKLFVKGKNNLAPRDQKTLAFGFDEREVGIDKKTGKPIIAPYIIWHAEPVDITATEALQAAAESKSPSARENAKCFLETLLNDGPVNSTDVQEAAKENGISPRTLRRAKDEIGIDIKRDGPIVNGVHTWRWHLATKKEDEK